MSDFKIFDIAGSGMQAQTLRMNLVSSNLANADAISSSIEEVYRSRQPVFKTMMNDIAGQTNAAGAAGVGVQVAGVLESNTRSFPSMRLPIHRQMTKAIFFAQTSTRSRRWLT